VGEGTEVSAGGATYAGAEVEVDVDAEVVDPKAEGDAEAAVLLSTGTGAGIEADENAADPLLFSTRTKSSLRFFS